MRSGRLLKQPRPPLLQMHPPVLHDLPQPLRVEAFRVGVRLGTCHPSTRRTRYKTSHISHCMVFCNFRAQVERGNHTKRVKIRVFILCSAQNKKLTICDFFDAQTYDRAPTRGRLRPRAPRTLISRPRYRTPAQLLPPRIRSGPTSMDPCSSDTNAAAHAQGRSSRSLQKHWKTKGETACAPSLTQAARRLSATGNSARRPPRQRQPTWIQPHASPPSPAPQRELCSEWRNLPPHGKCANNLCKNVTK